MAKSQGGAALQALRTLFSVGAPGGLTDGELLGLFTTRHGEAAELAFAAIVERHGPMVFRICCTILGGRHDAEDAFQATFLVLAQRAGSIRRRESAASWLHGVALRVAHAARLAAARRSAHERRAAGKTPLCSEGAGWDDDGAVVHEEIGRLPERYRAAIVLCDLEGLTEGQAAARLGVPVGTVRSRLARGRERLRSRLARRGLAPDASCFVAMLRPDVLSASIPQALIDSTTGAALRFLTARATVRGCATTLAQEVLRSMSLIRSLQIGSAVLAVGAAASGVLLLAQEPASRGPTQGAPAAGARDTPLHEARPGKMSITVDGRGKLESSSSLEGINTVEGMTEIISILPEGTRVTKGQLVCELDSSNLRDQLTVQEIATKRAFADLERVQKTREVAEIAVKEYLEGTFPLEAEALQGQIKVAEGELVIAADDREAAEKGPSSPREQKRAQLAVLKAELALQSARGRLDVLQRYTRQRVVKSLQAEVEKAVSEELARKAASELGKSKEEKLKKQIDACKLYAPGDGLLVYADVAMRAGDSHPARIEEGAVVRERQKIFSLPDLSQMRVNAKVPEAWVDRVVPGQKVRIGVDAFAQRVFEGTVKAVQSLPDPTSFFARGEKVYTTLVTIDNPQPGLRPGMTAQVEILVAELENVISVPVEAVLRFDGKDHVAVRKPDGGFAWREVSLGLTDGKLVEVKQGLRDGERVSLNPRALMSEEERREKLVAPPQ